VPKTIAYIRAFTGSQGIPSQRVEILEYARGLGLSIDEFVEFRGSSQLSIRERRIEDLLEKLKPGDTIVVTELSRLARSLGEILQILDQFTKCDICFHSIAQCMRLVGEHDMGTKMQIALFGLMAELELDLRTMRKKASEGHRVIGIGSTTRRSRKNKLDGREAIIAELLRMKISKAGISRIWRVSCTTLNNFILSRKLGT